MAVGVIVFDGGDQPAVGVVHHRRNVRPAGPFDHIAVLVRLAFADQQLVDRSVLADKRSVSVRQAVLGGFPGAVALLGAQHVPNGVTDWDKATDDGGMGGEHANGAATGLDRHRDGQTVHHLHQHPGSLGQQVGAFLDGCPVGGGADTHDNALPGRGNRLRRFDRHGDVCGGLVGAEQANGIGQGAGQVGGSVRQAGIGHAELAGPDGMASQHHRGIGGEVCVDRCGTYCAVHRDARLAGPGRAGAGGAFGPAAEEQQVNDDIGAGGGAHSGGWQADRAEEVGHALDQHAGAVVVLLKHPPGHDEATDASRAQSAQGAGDEELVQGQAAHAVNLLLDRPVAERWVADHQVLRRDVRAVVGEAFQSDVGLGVQQPGDARGDGIVFNPGQDGAADHVIGHQGPEQAGAATSLKHGAATEPEAVRGLPHCPDDELRGVVGILRGALQAGPLVARGGGAKLCHDLFPSGPAWLAAHGENAVGKVGGTEPGEAHQPVLFGRGGGPVLLLDQLHQPYGRDVVRRAAFPGGGKCTVAGHPMVGRVGNALQEDLCNGKPRCEQIVHSGELSGWD